MGLRRLRRRLNGLEAHAHQTMSDAQILISLAEDLVADLQDGVSVEIDIDDDAARKLAGIMISGEGGRLPFSMRVDPTWDIGDEK